MTKKQIIAQEAVSNDGADNSDKCRPEVINGCTSCSNNGESCNECDIGWYRYVQTNGTYKCSKCTKLTERPGMDFCDQCNAFVCLKCQKGYQKLMGGCFKCYFDWQCDGEAEEPNDVSGQSYDDPRMYDIKMLKQRG